MLNLSFKKISIFTIVAFLFLQSFSLVQANAAQASCGFTDPSKLSTETPFMVTPSFLISTNTQLKALAKTDTTITWLDPKQCLIEGIFSGSIYNITSNEVTTVSVKNSNIGNGKSTSTIIGWIPLPGVNTLHYGLAYSFVSLFSNCPTPNPQSLPCAIDFKPEVGLDKSQVSLGTFVDQSALDSQAAKAAAEAAKIKEKEASDKVIADKIKAEKLLADQLAAAKAANDAKYYAGQVAANSPIRTSVSLTWVNGKLRASWPKTTCRNGIATVVLFEDGTMKTILISGKNNSNAGFLDLKAKKAKSYFTKLTLTSCSNGKTYSNLT